MSLRELDRLKFIQAVIEAPPDNLRCRAFASLTKQRFARSI
jgi:hypothetical protein